MPGSGRGYFAELQEEENLYQVLQTQLRSAVNRRNELMRQLQGEQPVLGESSKYDTEINQQEALLNNLLLKYTEEHPEVVELRETIAELKKT